ncbi:MAG: hypothetical protein ABSB87_18155 [Terriglobales bacterium]|jgi:hypothetical protein
MSRREKVYAACRLHGSRADSRQLETWQRLERELCIAPALNSVVGGPSKLFEGSGVHIHGAIDSLVKRAIKSRDIRRDLEPFDLLRALIGVSHVASVPDWQQSARRLVDILITGSRPVK